MHEGRDFPGGQRKINYFGNAVAHAVDTSTLQKQDVHCPRSGDFPPALTVSSSSVTPRISNAFHGGPPIPNIRRAEAAR